MYAFEGVDNDDDVQKMCIRDRPLYKEIIAIGLIDSYVGVIITGLCSASTIFFFKQYLSCLLYTSRCV